MRFLRCLAYKLARTLASKGNRNTAFGCPWIGPSAHGQKGESPLSAWTRRVTSKQTDPPPPARYVNSRPPCKSVSPAHQKRLSNNEDTSRFPHPDPRTWPIQGSSRTKIHDSTKQDYSPPSLPSKDRACMANIWFKADFSQPSKSSWFGLRFEGMEINLRAEAPRKAGHPPLAIWQFELR